MRLTIGLRLLYASDAEESNNSSLVDGVAGIKNFRRANYWNPGFGFCACIIIMQCIDQIFLVSGNSRLPGLYISQIHDLLECRLRHLHKLYTYTFACQISVYLISLRDYTSWQ